MDERDQGMKHKERQEAMLVDLTGWKRLDVPT